MAWTSLMLALALLASGRSGVAFADKLPDGAAPRIDTEAARGLRAPPKNHVRMMLEATSFFGFNAAYYWLHTDKNAEDWDLHWDWPSWRSKLTSFDEVRFDTNYFWTNAVTHPIAGGIYYQIARANGYGPLGATAVNATTAIIWEYVAEFKERMSLNDLVVNTMTGFGAAEPMVQVSRAFRSMPRTPINRVLGFLFAPFEALHDPTAPLSRRTSPWHRFRLSTGAAATSFDGDGAIAEELVNLDLQLVTRRGYGRPGEQSVTTGGGGWTRVLARLAMGRAEPDSGLPGVRIATQTTFIGHYGQKIGDDGRGTGLFAGAGTGFLYETRRLAEDQDRLLVGNIVGPRFELGVYRPGLTMRFDLAAYLDFGMVQAHVFGPDLPFDPMPPFTTPLRRFGYYYAYGTTVDARAVLEAPRWQLDAQVWGHAFHSIDGRDRIEMNGATPEDPEGVTDQRLYGRLELTTYPWNGAVGLGASVDGAIRRGAWKEQTRDTFEQRAAAQLSIRF